VTVPGITIEHIFPQNPDPEWRNTVDEDDYVAMGEHYLNTIGNLTLSGNNGRLGNKTFAQKRDMNESGGEQGYRFSRLWLNRDLQTLDHWNVAQVEARAERIALRFLEVWPAPSVDVLVGPDSEEVNIFDAEEPKFKKLEYAVFLGNRLWVTQVSRLYVEVIQHLLSQQPDAFHGTKLGDRIQLTADAASLRQSVQVGDGYFVEGNIDSTTKFERMKFTLTELSLEDELSIKFA